MLGWFRPILPALLLIGGCAATSAQQPAVDNGRMFWIGSDGRRQFSDRQIEFLTDTADSIVIAQFHAGFDIDAHHAFARRAKAQATDVRIFGYMSGTYIRTRFEWIADKYQDDWILRDRDGEAIVHKFRENGEVAAYFADLTNPEYRRFIADTAAEWMDIAPYDGIIFDASNYVHGAVRRTFMDDEPQHPRFRTAFRAMLTQEKMDAVNAGLEALFRETKAAIGDKQVVWNGFWRKRHTINRSLGLMPYGDVSVAERWSIHRPTDPRQPNHAVLSRDDILEDLGIVQKYLDEGEAFFLKDTYDENWYRRAKPEAIAKLARFGWAMYMMIREPGRVSYGFSPGPRYRLNTDSDPVLLEPNTFGAASGPFEDLGRLLTRSFEHGVVYMNPTTRPVRVTVKDSMTLLHGEGVAARVTAGTAISVPAQDGVFLMKRP